MKPIVTGSLVALTALSLTGNVLMYLRYSSSRPLVTVGSQVISKKQYQDAVDYQTQGSILKKMVLADLVNQAAAKAGLMPTSADVDAQIAEMRRTTPQLLANAEQDPARMNAFRADLLTQLALENLQTQGVGVTDAEVINYYNRHKAQFKLPQQSRTMLVVAKNSVDAAQAANLLKQNINLDIIARQPRLQVVGMNGFNINWQAVPTALYQKISATIFQMKVGSVQTIPLKGNYLVARVVKSAGAGIPPLAQIRPQVTRLVELQKGTPAWMEIAKVFQANKPQFAVARYADYFNDYSTAKVTQPLTQTASAK